MGTLAGCLVNWTRSSRAELAACCQHTTPVPGSGPGKLPFSFLSRCWQRREHVLVLLAEPLVPPESHALGSVCSAVPCWGRGLAIVIPEEPVPLLFLEMAFLRSRAARVKPPLQHSLGEPASTLR